MENAWKLWQIWILPRRIKWYDICLDRMIVIYTWHKIDLTVVHFVHNWIIQYVRWTNKYFFFKRQLGPTVFFLMKAELLVLTGICLLLPAGEVNPLTQPGLFVFSPVKRLRHAPRQVGPGGGIPQKTSKRSTFVVSPGGALFMGPLGAQA